MSTKLQAIECRLQRCAVAGFLICAWSLVVVDRAVADDSLTETPVSAADREHWSFRPLARPAIPAVNDESWPRTAVDFFILATLEKKGLSPLPEADRETLIRRLSFDLRGLPPTPAEIDEFLNDNSPDAYERLVDRFLASPRHGEHTAQAWLDLARFAETDGFEHDKTRPNAWKYRDWVIDALNADLPYDEFVRRQLAGDELFPGDESAVIATAFCLSGPDMPDVNSQAERRHHLLNEITSTVGSVLLGLQVGCAQCHDHKYDPLSQADFYRLRAVFEPAVSVEKDKSVSVFKEGVYKPQASRLWLKGDHNRPGPEVSAAFPRIANPWNDEPILDAAALESRRIASSGRRSALAKWVTRPDHALALRVAANRLWQQHFGHGLSRTPNDFGIVGESPSHPELLDWLAGEMVRVGWSQKQLHRLIVLSAVYRQAGHPAASPDKPQEQARAQASYTKSLAADPANELWSRFPRRRLEGEAIRDAMLAASSTLSTRRGGPGVRPPLPAELVETLLKGQWETSPSAEDHQRRSVYIFARRNLRYPVFEAFDRPDANASCAKRNLSTTAPQSLLMLNSEFSLATAQRLAGVVLAESDRANPELVSSVFRRVLGRLPTTNELDAALAFLRRQRDLLGGEGRPADKLALPLPSPTDFDPHAAAALVDLCLALFNTSEFIYVD